MNMGIHHGSTDKEHIRNLAGQEVFSHNHIEGITNILDPRLRDIVALREKKGALNGEFSSSLRDVIMEFVPTVSEPSDNRLHDEPTMPKNLSRKARKQWKATNASKHIPQQSSQPQFLKALEKVQTQVFAAIRTTTKEVEAYYEKQQSNNTNTISELDKKHYIHLLSTLGIPYTVFENVDASILKSYTDQYMQHKDNVVTQYNYVADMIREKAIGPIKTLLESATQHPALGYESYLLKRASIVQILKEIYHHACFNNIVPVQPGYILHVFKQELKKAGVKQEFRGFIGQPVHKFLNGVFAEVYGGKAMQYIMQCAKQDGIKMHDVTLEDTSKALLDIHARSDEQYYVSLPSDTQFIQSVDFKSFADGEPSIIAVTEKDPAYYDHIHFSKQFIPEQLHALPVKPIEFRVGIPTDFAGKLYTQEVFATEFSLFYDQYKSYLTQQGLIV